MNVVESMDDYYDRMLPVLRFPALVKATQDHFDYALGTIDNQVIGSPTAS